MEVPKQEMIQAQKEIKKKIEKDSYQKQNGGAYQNSFTQKIQKQNPFAKK